MADFSDFRREAPSVSDGGVARFSALARRSGTAGTGFSARLSGFCMEGAGVAGTYPTDGVIEVGQGDSFPVPAWYGGGEFRGRIAKRVDFTGAVLSPNKKLCFNFKIGYKFGVIYAII